MDTPPAVGLPPAQGRPGELQSGGYGFYYKGDRRETPAQPADVLQNLQTVITPLVTRERSTGPAIPYKELVSSPVYFSNEKWQECLSSHGLIVDAESRTLTVQSESVPADLVYDLTEEETAVLTSNSIEEHPVEKRIGLINDIIAADYRDKVTMETLDSNRRIDIGLHPEVEEDLALRQQQEQQLFEGQQQDNPIGQMTEGAVIDGRDLYYLNENRGWYKEGRHGREVEVNEIAVHPAETEGKYRMTAVIDGQVVSHEISQKDYEDAPRSPERARREDIRRSDGRCRRHDRRRTRDKALPSCAGVLRRAVRRSSQTLFQTRSGHAARCGDTQFRGRDEP